MEQLNFRIYGDNILECEKTLKYIFRSFYGNYNFDFKKYKIDSPSYSPAYGLNLEEKRYIFTLYPAYYNRWNSNIIDLLMLKGATLKEGPDSIVTKITDLDNEEIVFGTEYCGALPAGNNAWQRLGRPLAFAEAGIPFLYYSEIGGMELDSKTRENKIGRMPNPLVPYSLISASLNYPDATILPIYTPSPTITFENNEKYKNIFSEDEGFKFIYSILTEDNILKQRSVENIREKGIEFIKLLIENRKNKDVLSFDELSELSEEILKNNANIFFEVKQRKWNKIISISISDEVRELLEFSRRNCISMGADNFAFCQVPALQKTKLIRLLEELYSEKSQIIEEIKHLKKPIALCWITGFKPKGEDSRPDRGLLPLLKLIYGNEYCVIPIVFGPIKASIAKNWHESIKLLPENNGLWRAIFTQSDFVIIDSATTSRNSLGSKENLKDILDVRTYRSLPVNSNYIPCQGPPIFGEDDVDSAIHNIFSYNRNPNLIFESLCNPPGGDWSGVEIFLENKYFRWSSLPRVTKNAKRPDHIIQFGEEFLIIESKFSKKDLEENVGERLKSYVETLFKTSPNSVKNIGEERWRQNESVIDVSNFKYLSGVAYYLNNNDRDISDEDDKNIAKIFRKTECDIIIEIHFKENGQISYRFIFKNDDARRWFISKKSLMFLEDELI